MSERDFVLDLIERVRARMPSLTQEEALALEAEIRTAWGGERPFIAKDLRRRQHVRAAIVADGMSAAPTKEVLKKHGISRATLYRLVKKGNTPAQG